MASMGSEQLANLFQQHGASLVLYARQFCVDPEDVVQEVFIKLYRQDPIPDQPHAWLYRVTRNAALNHGRNRKRRSVIESELAMNELPWFAPQENTEKSNQVVDANDLTDFVSELPIELREVLVARVWGELTLQQTAELVQSSVSTVHRREVEAFRRLRQGINLHANSESTRAHTDHTSTDVGRSDE